MCKDVGVGLLLSPARKVLLLGSGDPFTFFVKDCEAATGVGNDVVFKCLGVEAGKGLTAEDTTFFLVPAKFLSFLVGVT